MLACCDAGGQTGGAGLEPPAPGCHNIKTDEVARSERTPLGFSADEVLDYAGGKHESAALWPVDPDDPNRAQGATITLTLTPQGSTAYLVPEQGGGCGSPRHLVIDVRVEIELRRDDASAHLVTDAMLEARTRDSAILTFARARPDAVDGDTMFALPPDTKVLDYAIEAMFLPTGTSGRITLRWMGSDASGAAVDAGIDHAELASWPPSDE